MNFSKLKLNEAALGDYSGMGTAAKATDGAMKSSQLQKSPSRKNMQSNLSTSLMGNKKRDSNVNIQKTTEEVEQYFNELRQEVEEVKAYESQKSDWRTELSEAVVDGQEREDHPYVTVMPTGDENLIQAIKQMRGEVKDEVKDKKGKLKAGSGIEEEVENLDEKKKDCKDGYKWDSDEGKCVKKKKKSNTTIIMGRGWGHGHHHDDDDNDGGGDEGGSDMGGDGGGGDGGGGMGEMFDYLADTLLNEINLRDAQKKGMTVSSNPKSVDHAKLNAKRVAGYVPPKTSDKDRAKD